MPSQEQDKNKYWYVNWKVELLKTYGTDTVYFHSFRCQNAWDHRTFDKVHVYNEAIDNSIMIELFP